MSDPYKRVNVPKGTRLFSEGDKGRMAFIVESGELEISKAGKGDEEVILTTINKGALVGEMALFDDNPRNANVTALTDSRLIVLTREVFHARIGSLDTFTFQMVRSLIDRVRTQGEILVAGAENLERRKNGAKDFVRATFVESASTTYEYGAIEFLLGDSNAQTRKALKGGLFQHGFREIYEVNNAVDLRSAIPKTAYDLMVVDASLGVADVTRIVDEVRHHKLGANPFMIIVCILDQPDPEMTRMFVDAGCDDILLKPLSLGNLMDRLERLIRTRKDFVVTSDYIGPDRRKSARSDAMEIPKLATPNPLKAKALDKMDVREFQAQVNEASKAMNEHKVERYVVQIAFLSERIARFLKKGRPLTEALQRLVFVTEDLNSRLATSSYAALAETCTPLIELAHQMRDTDPQSEVFAKYLGQLQQISKTIQTAFGTEEMAAFAEKAATNN